jgi:hypothetical protein
MDKLGDLVGQPLSALGIQRKRVISIHHRARVLDAFVLLHEYQVLPIFLDTLICLSVLSLCRGPLISAPDHGCGDSERLSSTHRQYFSQGMFYPLDFYFILFFHN